MTDFKEAGFMYAMGLVVAVIVVAQAVFFLVKAWRRGKELGITVNDMKNTVVTSVMFSITPALSIVATVVALAGALGLVLPWVRTLIIGNISFETAAASAAMEAYGLGGLTSEVTDPEVFSAIAWVMTLGSMLPLVIIPIFLKRIQKKMGKALSKDTKWADVISSAAFVGLICAFVGRAILGQGNVDVSPEVLTDGAGVLSVTALVFSVLFMIILQKIADKKQLKWLDAFAMPISMFAAMGVVILVSQLLPPEIAFLEWRG